MVNNNDKITLDWTYLGPIKDISTATIFKSNKTDKKNGQEIAKIIPGIYVWILPEKDKEKTFLCRRI